MNNNIKLIINKVGKALPIISLLIGLQNYTLANQAKLARVVQEDQLNRLEQAHEVSKNLTKELIQSNNTIINNQKILNIINNFTVKASENLDSVTHSSEIINQLIAKLNEPNLDEAQRELITKLYNKTIEAQADSLEKANNSIKEIIDSISPSINSPNEITIINQITNIFNNLIENIKVFASSLDIEQLVAFINLSGEVFIFTCFVSVGAVLYSDFLIKYFKVENKFPKIANYIQLRRKFQRYYLNINFLGAILMLIFLFSFNIYAIFK
jgi:hypothetical protein